MSEKIVTPMGEISVLIDDVEVQYAPIKCNSIESLCPDVLGRYQISIHFVPNGKEHRLACVFPHNEEIKGYPESGQDLECQGFYDKNSIKLSIGTLGESGIHTDYDYDIEYLDNGMQYVILPESKTQEYVFGICWINNIDINDQSQEMMARDVQTCFGADPMLTVK